MTKKIKVGIIGCGEIAFAKHMPGLAKLPGVELIAFCNRSREKAERAAAEFGSKDALVYQDYQKLLTNKKVNLVHICTPNNSHSEIAIAALEAGKDVMCEKPMAIDAEQAENMYQAAQNNNCQLSVSYQNRFRAENQLFKQMIQAGKLGDIYFAKSLALRRRGVPTWGYFLNQEIQGGGPLIDIGTHALDLTLWLMDNYQPKIVLANTFHKMADQSSAANYFGKWQQEDFEVEDSAFAHLIMENGASIILETSWALNIPEEYNIKTILSGQKAGGDNITGLRINGEKDGYLYRENLKTEQANLESSGDKEMRLWIESLQQETKPPVEAKQALVVAQILAAIYRSAASGEAVKF